MTVQPLIDEKDMVDPLHDLLIATVDRHKMFPPGSIVLVAVSGGQDSCALLHSLVFLRDRWGLTLHAAHFNHCLRGEESDEDARFVKALGQDLGVGVTLGDGDVIGEATRTRRSTQEAARTLRKRFLDRVADEFNAEKIATGHTLDDRIESVLHNIMRGTGVDGLRGIAPFSGRIVRPILSAPRAETAAYCTRHGIAYRSDPSNFSPAYTRSRIREELIPYVQAHYNPAIRDALMRLSDLAAADSQYLTEQAQALFDRVASISDADQIAFEIDAFREMGPAMGRRVLRLAIERLRGSTHDLEFRATEAVISSIAFEKGHTRLHWTLPDGDAAIDVDSKWITVMRTLAPQCAVRREWVLDVPGMTRIETWGLEIEVSEHPVPSAVEAPDEHNIMLDRSAIQGTTIARNRRPGDRLRPLGMTGSRKVQDILTDRKVPRDQRDRVPIIADDEGILWVVGHAIADRAKVTDSTTGVFRLEIRAAATLRAE